MAQNGQAPVNQTKLTRAVELADGILLSGQYAISHAAIQLHDLYSDEVADAWSRVISRMGMQNIPLREHFDVEMAALVRYYMLMHYHGSKPTVKPGWTCQNTLNFCFQLLKKLLCHFQNVRELARTIAAFEIFIRVVKALRPLLPCSELPNKTSTAHAVLFVLESSSNSFIYKRNCDTLHCDNGMHPVQLIFMNVVAHRLLKECPPSSEAINDPASAFGHFAGSNSLVCCLKRLLREFCRVVNKHNPSQLVYSLQAQTLLYHVQTLASENVVRLTNQYNHVMEITKAAMLESPGSDCWLSLKLQSARMAHSTDSLKRPIANVTPDRPAMSAEARKRACHDGPGKRLVFCD